jgi:hypothetical protein
MITFLETLKVRNEVLFYFSLVSALMAVFCLVLVKLYPIDLLGTSAWFKPFKFWLSSAILASTMAWYLCYLGKGSDVHFYSWGLILLLLVEDVYITWQASEGQLSHFNVSSPFYSLMFSVMAFCAVGIALWTAYFGLLFFIRDFPSLPPAYLWGIRLGIIVFVVFALQGLTMGSQLSHTVGAPDGTKGLPVVGWSRKFGDLRIAHFLGMHALQIIPLVSFYLLRDAKWAIAFGIGYLLFTSFTFWWALQGRGW